MIKSLYGPHIMDSAYNYASLIEEWNPAVALLLHPKLESVRIIREKSPDTIIIGRLYLDDHEYSEGIKNDPQGFAQYIHNRIMSTSWWSVVDYIQTNNEVNQTGGQLENLSEFSIAWMNLAQGFYHCAIGAFSVGQPGLTGDWPNFHDAMKVAVDNDHILLIHEYGWPDFWSPDKFYVGRYATKVWPTLPDDLKQLRFVLGEFGIDRLIINEKGGWRVTGRPATDIAKELKNYHFDINGWREQGVPCLGACLFSVGDLGWGDYDFAYGGDGSPLGHYVKEFLPHKIHPISVTPEEPPQLTFTRLIKAVADEKQVIYLYSKAALQKEIFADGFVPVSNEHTWTYIDGTTWVIQKAEKLNTNSVRVYYVQYGKYDVVYHVDY